jgi:hypothetical protein
MGARVSLVGAVVVASAAGLLGSGTAFAAGFAIGRITDDPPSTPAAARPAAVSPDLRAGRGLPEPPAPELPRVTLQVHGDGCGVIRPELADEPHGLGWSVTDADGFEVLQRNAVGETHYRYFQSGTYTMELVAWDGQTYSPISDAVTITC